jgi:hypothetical protein
MELCPNFEDKNLFESFRPKWIFLRSIPDVGDGLDDVIVAVHLHRDVRLRCGDDLALEKADICGQGDQGPML